MRMSGPLGRLMFYAACGSGTAAALWPSAAAAQGRSAAIRVLATVRGVGDTDVLGAHAEAAVPRARSGASTPQAEGWRVTPGRNASVGIRVEGAASVTICREPAARPEACAPYRAPRIATAAGGASPEFVVRVRPSASRRAGADPPVRLTVAFIDF